MSYNPLVDVCRLIMDHGVKTPFADELKGIIEKQAEYFMYLAAPNGRTPFLGDWGSDEREALERDAALFGRNDMLYVAKAGREGTKPKELSKLYPYAGIAILRSDWGDAGRPFEDARYLMLHGAHYGSHGHQDINGITVYAYGRELLGDPGSYIYGSPEHELLCTAPQHNLMTIDGQDQDRRSRPRFENWGTTLAADYMRSRAFYKAGTHIREVFYIRSNDDPALDYWVIRDTAEGEGSHSLEQRWHFSADIQDRRAAAGASIPSPPIEAGEGIGDEGLVRVDPTTLTARTTFTEGGNLCIMQVDPLRLEVERTAIDTWWPRGTTGKPFKMPTVIYKAHETLPAAIDTLLLPYKGPDKPRIELKHIGKSPDGLESAFKIGQGKVWDLFVFNRSGGRMSLADEKVSFEGERLYLRRVSGRLRSALLVKGNSLTVDGKQILKASKPLSWISFSIGADGTKVWTSSADPLLTFSAPKGTRTDLTNMDTDSLLQLRDPY